MIKVGMLVEIMGTNKWAVGPYAGETHGFRGHIGRVLEPGWVPDTWRIEGADYYKGVPHFFRTRILRPIRDDSDDISETRKAGHQDFNRFMSDIKTRRWEPV